MSWKVLAGIAVLTVGFAIGCTAVQPQTRQEPPQTVAPLEAPSPGGSSALEEKNLMRAALGLPPMDAEGEVQSTPTAEAGPRWTEQDAIGIVKRELQASTSGCLGYERPVDQHECYLKDPVLVGMRPALAELPARYVGEFVALVAERALAENTQWSAVFEVNQEMWRVEGIAEGIDSTLLFYVNESTGLVEGAPFTE